LTIELDVTTDKWFALALRLCDGFK